MIRQPVDNASGVQLRHIGGEVKPLAKSRQNGHQIAPASEIALQRLREQSVQALVVPILHGGHELLFAGLVMRGGRRQKGGAQALQQTHR